MRASGCSSCHSFVHDKCGYTDDLAAVPMHGSTGWSGPVRSVVGPSLDVSNLGREAFLPFTMVRGTRPTRVVTTGSRRPWLRGCDRAAFDSRRHQVNIEAGIKWGSQLCGNNPV